jgi:hypothetical protein
MEAWYNGTYPPVAAADADVADVINWNDDGGVVVVVVVGDDDDDDDSTKDEEEDDDDDDDTIKLVPILVGGCALGGNIVIGSPSGNGFNGGSNFNLPTG